MFYKIYYKLDKKKYTATIQANSEESAIWKLKIQLINCGMYGNIDVIEVGVC